MYHKLRIDAEKAGSCLQIETPKTLDNVRAQVVGSVRELCRAAENACRSMGYETVFLTDRLNCEAREAGRFLASILRSHANDGKKLAFLAGGDTLQELTDKGLLLHDVLQDNDAYHALQAVGGLFITGPTGTNVNDLSIGLLDAPE